MSVAEHVRGDMTAAMKSGDRERAAALRLVLSELQGAAKENKQDFDELDVLRRERKRRLDAARAYRDGGREDRAAVEEAEAELISAYLPAELDDEELVEIVARAISDAGAQSPKDMGKVMPLAMEAVQGRADGRRVSERVREALA
jgi:uncharacterized protein YqeY